MSTSAQTVKRSNRYSNTKSYKVQVLDYKINKISTWIPSRELIGYHINIPATKSTTILDWSNFIRIRTYSNEKKKSIHVMGTWAFFLGEKL